LGRFGWSKKNSAIGDVKGETYGAFSLVYSIFV
jgi:hypothetical protein